MPDFLNPKPIEINIETLQGVKNTLVLKNVTDEMINEIDSVLLNPANGVKELTITERLREQMRIIFGGRAEDYANYDIRVLKDVLNFVNQQIANPTKRG